ncbi:MAG: hypothetical protein ACLTBX_04485 [Clostridia bacterium]|nr:hypothetical protein [Clostridium sp.]
MKKKIFISVSIIVLLIVIASLGYFAIKQFNKSSFYAIIEDKIEKDNGNTIVFVKGLETNEEQWRGEIYFNIEKNEKVEIIYKNKNISISDLKVGDEVQITFEDKIINSMYPIPLNEVTKIELIDNNEI